MPVQKYRVFVIDLFMDRSELTWYAGDSVALCSDVSGAAVFDTFEEAEARAEGLREYARRAIVEIFEEG